jgi:hypothetical protein
VVFIALFQSDLGEGGRLAQHPLNYSDLRFETTPLMGCRLEDGCNHHPIVDELPYFWIVFDLWQEIIAKA